MNKAAFKLVALACAGTGLFFIQNVVVMACALCLTTVVYFISGFGVHKVWAQIRPILFFWVVLVVAQGVIVDWSVASLIGLRFLTLILLAAWVTLTTPMTDMIGVLVKALKPFIKYPRRISFILLLTWRFIPLVAQITSDVKEAQHARNSTRKFKLNLTYTAIPVIVRTLSMADTISEALDARGFESAS